MMANVWLGLVWFILALQGGGAADGASQLEGGAGFAWMLLQTLFALAAVCALMYLVFRWMLPRLGAVGTSGGLVRVADAVVLEQHKRLYVIQAGGRWMLIASSEAGVQMLAELDPAAVEEKLGEIEGARRERVAAGSAARELLAAGWARLRNRRE